MISARTKQQLIAFVIITLLGCSYVGAKYAKLGELFYDTSYDVNAHFSHSGGIFTGAEVTYRGVGVGRVTGMKLTREGVDVVLAIDKQWRRIPADTLAQVADKSAVGEQYVDLQPQTDHGPYLHQGSVIEDADTSVPVSTTALLTNLDNLVNSVPRNDLRTVVSEFGTAFQGTGRSLGQIIDTSTSFIDTANRNFDVTTALIRDSNVVLRTQADKGSAIRAFSRNLALFSGTLAGHDRDLRTLIDNGSATADELRTFLEQNRVNLGELINDLLTTGEIQVRHLHAIRQLLVIYPYEVAGGYTVTRKGPDGGYDARFGVVLTSNPPVCHHGYEGSDRRPPQDRADRPMYTGAHCAEPASQSDARGSQHAPNGRTGVAYRSPVATYDASTGRVAWSDEAHRPRVVNTGGSGQVFGKDSWKWLLFQPALTAGG
jgi:phospholipid/cholesterol/gamma-HCH transport system substrate-binding protein